ncbi:MAG: cobyrinic acid ac-diamide synthase [Bacteroidetes bacterium GWC2_33_15]|nr:MAG: cobyrinic acid ac-diamide synthase [Bacteroidetes bacterium GWA2_33_15]OFX50029.1 MAG: cobyrinic acid ac-diamide synthase [Bacteroidetes bacterium GWC2_33_15]OFX65183.1 MAG: cobyrinic acid ac-diamide synthase [Bacteroidetes bacterium GWB2_32_14]OFX70408.1 MAG: cobyrinic acid ac-diamide synthase [Bacteroidetes bacterium GWD2_33_33]HAN19724.1 ParA family protein [Bacteroidales bacterium]
MAHIISVINNKGGTGKTTTTLNLGMALSGLGYKVLLIDFDSQSNLTSSLGINKVENHIGKLLLNDLKINDVLVPLEHLSVIPSTNYLLDYEYRINSEPGREYLLKEALEPIHPDFDYIIVDCAPSLGTFAINSLVAADYFIVPMQAENFAFIGLDKIIQITDKVKKRMNSRIEMAGILFVKYSARTKFSKAVFKSLSGNVRFKRKVFETKIRTDISLMESTAFGENVFSYAPKSHGAEDYLNLANEFIKKYGKK